MLNLLFVTAGVIVSVAIIAVAVVMIWPLLKYVLGIGLFAVVILVAYSYKDWLGVLVLFGGLIGFIMIASALDPNIAKQRLMAKAERGDADAQFRLAEMLGPAQQEERERWYRMAAEQGHAVAERNLGLTLYKYPTHPEAAKWLRVAADKGDATAQRNLALLYESGLGVPRSLVEAYKWYALDAENDGDDFWGSSKRRDQVRRKLTPDQLAEAERLVQEWRTTVEQGQLVPTQQLQTRFPVILGGPYA
jgi:hypothetical protein